ncbi:MAG: Fe-S protein assembly co-chaperone HscB [Neisseriaceae bacterium]|nr:Fe-S protein assembly co-chaperone HscB [Neisseriaceae bacterium]
MNNFFNIFQLPQVFDINYDILEKNYRNLASQYHPDRTTMLSAFEQRQQMMLFATINQAYETLKNPLTRANYILKLNGIDADEKHSNVDSNFLMQQMQLREELETAQTQEEYKLLHNKIYQEQQEIINKLTDAFSKSDFEMALNNFQRARFINKLLEEIENKLE